jgi:NTE family protein
VPEAATLFMPQIRAFSYFALGGRAIFHLTKNTDVRFETHLFNPYRELVASETQQAIVKENYSNLYGIATVTGVFHTLLGPVSLNLNYYHRSPSPFHAGISFGYILFNRKAWF